MTNTVQGIVSTRDERRPTSVFDTIQALQPEIARALPKGMDADRIARLALTCVRKDRALAECDPRSFAGALLTASALGLEPGVNGEAWLVAYKRECTLIIGYQGFAKLFWQHPLAATFDAHTVHAADVFDYQYGTDPHLIHRPAPGDRGPITHYYATASLTNGAFAFVVLTTDEVKALRGGKVGTNGGIPDPQHWMEKKTAVRQLVKLLPRSTALNRALTVDEQPGHRLYAEHISDRNALSAAPEQTQAPAPLDVPAVTREPEQQPARPARTPMATAQRGRMFALFAEAGITRKDGQYDYIHHAIGRPITSRAELNADEASVVIQMLEHDLAPGLDDAAPVTDDATEEPSWTS